MKKGKDMGLLVIILAGLLMASDVLSIDGDVQYSAPYLTVDPKTGEIVKKRRAPQPKSHSMEPGEAEDSTSGSPESKTTPTGLDEAMGTEPETGYLSVIVILAGGVIVLVIATLLLRWKKAKMY